MLGRYVGLILMTLLVGLWLAGGVFGVLRLSATRDTAAKVRAGVQTVRTNLESREDEDIARVPFPEGEIARMVQSSWSTGLPAVGFPRGLSAAPTSPSPQGGTVH
ncbi:MAG: hypothetical protein GXY85_07885 [Candidatus Brocadiaceae bacterium]|nr:hypothetical protein [Candidatus Brocadiaceae bacterium]